MKNFNLPALGGGAGLRHAHFAEILETKPDFNWFEIINEDFYSYGGRSREVLQEIKKTYPIIGHSVALSIGSTDPLNIEYLKDLKVFLKEINSPWTSDHLCFTMIDHTNLNELIPLPFTNEAVRNVVSRIKIIQDILEVPFLIENITRYITVSNREMSEIEFINRIIAESGCGLLLDITNVYLNSQYHKYDPWEFIKTLPLDKIGQIHLAGSEPDENGVMIDSHDAPVMPEVWDLFKKTLDLSGPTSALVEWDNSLPTVQQLLQEAKLADQIIKNLTTKKAYAAC